MKRCTGCGVEKPTTEFRPDLKRPGATRGVCRPCRNARAREQRANPLPNEPHLLDVLAEYFSHPFDVVRPSKRGRGSAWDA